MSKKFKLGREKSYITEYSPETPIIPPAISFLSYERHTDLVSGCRSEYLDIHIELSETKRKDYECIKSQGKISVTDEKNKPAMDSLKINLKSISPGILEEILSQIDSKARNMLKKVLE